MAEERTGVITFKGGAMTLLGPELKVGDAAPDFSVVDGAMGAVTLASSAGKTRLISVVPSVDTPVCAIQTKRFNEEAAKLGDDVVVYTVSVDLPMAQKRFCGAEGIDKIVAISDYRSRSFGENYGVLIKELMLLSRAVFVIGPDDKIKYIEIVKEVTDLPDYDKALAALQ
ncbi:thiol peroxidase [Candidatus Sumerlaeota bacterium]|nr:thiol peroxidase [Candidatus Sumerlaeota bacterium]